jgi:hypothetical protein
MNWGRKRINLMREWGFGQGIIGWGKGEGGESMNERGG